MVIRNGFNRSSCRREEADGVYVSTISASSRRQLCADSNFETASRIPARSARRRGSLIAELIVAMALLVGVILPIAYSIGIAKNLARLDYRRVVAMEIVDGEMETLAAGEWRSCPAGTHPYVVHADSAINLPPGQFLLTVETNRLRLEWRPDGKHHGGPVVREAPIR